MSDSGQLEESQGQSDGGQLEESQGQSDYNGCALVSVLCIVCGFANMMCRASWMHRTCLLLS